MIAVQVLMDKLNSFEDTQEIVEFFESQDVQGQPGESNSCVITNWVKRESGEEYVTTAAYVKVWSYDYEYSVSPKERHGVSDVVCAFILNFDKGRYPTLVDGYDEYLY